MGTHCSIAVSIISSVMIAHYQLLHVGEACEVQLIAFLTSCTSIVCPSSMELFLLFLQQKNTEML